MDGLSGIVNLDARLIANDFEPLAVAGKRPVAVAWQERPNTVEALAAERAAYPHAVSAGLRTGRTVAVDIDLHDKEHAATVKSLAAEVLGHPGMVRIGAKGMMLCYQNKTPLHKITISDMGGWTTPTGHDENSGLGPKPKRRTLVEVLGVGQQFVAYGIHPDTGQPYAWPDAHRGGEPLQTPLADLPEVTPGRLREFARRAAALLTELGYCDVAVSDPGDPERRTAREAKRRADRTPVPEDYLTRMLAVVPSDCDRNRWVGSAGGIQATNLRGVPEEDMDARLCEIVQEWSHGDYCGSVPANWISNEEVADMYYSLDPERPGGTTFGSLYHTACENGWNEPPPQPLASESWDACDLIAMQAEQVVALEDDDMSEPFDLFASTVPEPVLKHHMLPASAAIAFVFDTARRMGVDPAIPLMGFFAVTATCIHDAIKIQRKRNDTRHLERAHFNGLFVAEPGRAKSPAVKAMKAPLEKIEIEWRQGYAAQIAIYDMMLKVHQQKCKEYIIKTAKGELSDPTGSGIPEKPVKPAQRRLIAVNATVEGLRDVMVDNPAGLLNFQDEVSGWIASWDIYRSRSGADRAFYLQTDDGGPMPVDRAGGNGVVVPNVSLSFIGGIQEDKLREIAPTLTSDGFIQRAFGVIADEQHEEQDAVPDYQAIEAYDRLLRGLLALKPEDYPRPITLSPEAHEHREHVENVVNAYLQMPTTSAPLRQHLAKWKGKFARLLMLYHAVECVSAGETLQPEVSGETAKRARLFMLKYLLPHALRFYAEFFDDDTSADARWIAGYILANKLERVTGREIKRAYDKVRPTEFDERKQNPDWRLGAAMQTLEEARWVRSAETGRTRWSISWPVNPRVHVLYAARAQAERERREAIKWDIAAAGATIDCERADA